MFAWSCRSVTVQSRQTSPAATSRLVESGAGRRSPPARPRTSRSATRPRQAEDHVRGNGIALPPAAREVPPRRPDVARLLGQPAEPVGDLGLVVRRAPVDRPRGRPRSRRPGRRRGRARPRRSARRGRSPTSRAARGPPPTSGRRRPRRRAGSGPGPCRGGPAAVTSGSSNPPRADTWPARRRSRRTRGAAPRSRVEERAPRAGGSADVPVDRVDRFRNRARCRVRRRTAVPSGRSSRATIQDRTLDWPHVRSVQPAASGVRARRDLRGRAAGRRARSAVQRRSDGRARSWSCSARIGGRSPRSAGA